jgi:hypothetical protein
MLDFFSCCGEIPFFFALASVREVLCSLRHLLAWIFAARSALIAEILAAITRSMEEATGL